jgi:hypothetical protein
VPLGTRKMMVFPSGFVDKEQKKDVVDYYLLYVAEYLVT